MHINTLKRIQIAVEITKEHYEPGRRDLCYKEVWRRYVYPKCPCCYRTYLNYMGINVGKEIDKIDTVC
jgi:hypothetical protein